MQCHTLELTMPKTYGYIRVSTLEQDLMVQREALIGAGVKPDLIIKEKASGTKRDGRDKLDLVLKLADKGDTIVITRVIASLVRCTTSRISSTS